MAGTGVNVRVAQERYAYSHSDQYYLFEGTYFKLKSAKATRFQCSFRLDAINTCTSKRE